MDSLRFKINKYVEHRTRIDKDLFSSFEMRNDCLRELEKFNPRTEEEKEMKLRYIRKFQVALVENRTAGNVKFYTTQLLAKEEEKERGLSETQRKMNDMIKDLRKLTTENVEKVIEKKANISKKDPENRDDRFQAPAKARHTRFDEIGESSNDHKRSKVENQEHGHGSNQHGRDGRSNHRKSYDGNYEIDYRFKNVGPKRAWTMK